ncbi:MAG: FdtA/QdtA family cupin domain-containing protein [Parcubacteria group bacterium]|nr:FdtA/QdtA family cupin domain-containing protein [Parcubacteria group bacterium]
MLKFKEEKIKKIDANNFIMSPVELKDYIDFEVKRVYFVSEPKGETGSHCHLKEEEFFILAKGSCTAIVDRGNGLEKISMKGPESAMYVGNYVWHHFEDFSSDALLIALSSTNYNPNRSDYIEDYEEYKKMVEEKGLV